MSTPGDMTNTTPKKIGVNRLKLVANLVAKSQNFVSKLRSCRTSDLLQESYDTVSELCAGTPRPEESTFEASRRRSDVSIFNSFKTEVLSNDHLAKNERASRIRRERAAKLRAVKSLTRCVGVDDIKQDQATGEADNGLGERESERVDIPDFEIRDPAEEALLLACSCRLEAIKASIEAAQKARETVGIPELLAAFQQLCLNRAKKRHARSQSLTLKDLGMQDLSELLLTLRFRTERWLRNSNDPLVIALSDYEATLDQLTAAQELRVESASEVLAGMKLIADSSKAGRDAFLIVRERVQDAAASYRTFVNQLNHARVLLQQSLELGNEHRDYIRFADAHLASLDSDNKDLSGSSDASHESGDEISPRVSESTCLSSASSASYLNIHFMDEYLKTAAVEVDGIFTAFTQANFDADTPSHATAAVTANTAAEDEASTEAPTSTRTNTSVYSPAAAETKEQYESGPEAVEAKAAAEAKMAAETNAAAEAEIILSIKEAAAWFKASGEMKASAKKAMRAIASNAAPSKFNDAVHQASSSAEVEILSHMKHSTAAKVSKHGQEIDLYNMKAFQSLSEVCAQCTDVVPQHGVADEQSDEATNVSDVVIVDSDHSKPPSSHQHLKIAFQDDYHMKSLSKNHSDTHSPPAAVPPAATDAGHISNDDAELAALELIAEEIESIRAVIIDESLHVLQSAASDVLMPESPDLEHVVLRSDSASESANFAPERDARIQPAVVADHHSEECVSDEERKRMPVLKWMQPMTYEQRMLDGAHAAAASANVMRQRRYRLDTQRIEAMRISSDRCKVLPILDFIELKVMKKSESSQSGRNNSEFRQLLKRRRRLRRRMLRKHDAVQAQSDDNEQRPFLFQPCNTVSCSQLFPALPFHPSNAARIRGYAASPKYHYGSISIADADSSSLAHNQRGVRSRIGKDRLRNVIAGLGDSSVDLLMQAIVAIFRNKLGLSSQLAHHVQQSIIGGVHSRIGHWRQHSTLGAECSSSHQDHTTHHLVETISHAAKEFTSAENPTLTVRQRLPSADDTLITPRLFPSFKSSPNNKTYSHRTQNGSFSNAAHLESIAFARRTAAVAAAAADISVQLPLQGQRSSTEPATVVEPSPTPNTTFQENTDKVSSLPPNVLLGPDQVSHVSSKSRPATAGTRPSTSGSVSISLPSARIFGTHDCFETNGVASMTSCSLLPSARIAANDASAGTKSNTAISRVPKLDMSSITRFKHQNAPSQRSVQSDRGSSLPTLRTLEMFVSSEPHPPSARGYSGHKLVGGTPVSKMFAKERQKDTGKPLMCLICSPLLARIPMPPSHPPPSSATSSRRCQFSRDNVDDFNSTSTRIYQEFETRYRN